MADASSFDSSWEAPIEDPILACVVALRDRLSAADVRKQILDNFRASAIKIAKKLLWAARQAVLRQKKKKLIERRAAQRAVEEAEFDDLEDFANCLDECEKLPLVSVSSKDLFLLPAAVVKPAPPSLFSVESTEASSAAATEMLAAQCESIKAIQDKITCLESELKGDIRAMQKNVLSQARSASLGCSK